MSVDWSPTAPLPASGRVVIEASAGTGKTWQIEGIVARLVAEEGIPIERIVAITFTDAAAADLRARVRRRLELTYAALVTGRVPEDDEVVAHLCASGADSRRVERALAHFDRAPISTIHGFCNCVLDQLAFESGADPERQLGDGSELVKRLVADELARLHHGATAEDRAFLVAISPDALRAVALAMTGPVAPAVAPPPEEGGATRWAEARRDARAWLDGPGATCVAALENEATTAKAKRRLPKLTPKPLQYRLADLRAWLDGDSKGASGWTLDALEGEWTGTASELASFAGREVYARVSDLLALRARLVAVPLARFAARVRAAHVAELARRGVLTYDGMLGDLASVLAGAGADHPLVAAVRARYDVALVDEFQDTDSAQWTILRALFGRLTTVGDPKQAIYAFRHADLDVYLESVEGHVRHDLRCNRRSDRPLVDALNALWQHAAAPFGSRIAYVTVEPANEARLAGLPEILEDGALRPRRALELRWFDGGDPARSVARSAIQEQLVRACALECRAILASGARIDGRAVRPRDIGVLTPTNDQAEALRRALDALGIPAVTGGRESVFDAEAAGWLRAWLVAVASGERNDERRFALTPLGGLRWIDLASRESEAAVTRLRVALREAAEGWPEHGFALAFDRLLRDGALARAFRLGERSATDLRHLGELCDAEDRRGRAGAAALAAWLDAQRGQGDDHEPVRLETDASAVQVVTVHKSKGLEYPICLLPIPWKREPEPEGPVVARVGGVKSLFLDTASPEWAAAAAAKRDAEIDESMRLLYVATTRARHHVVAWVGPVLGGCALSRLLAENPEDPAELRASIERLVATGRIGCAPTQPEPPDFDVPPEAARRVDDWDGPTRLGVAWRVTSYSALAEGRAHEDGPTPAEQDALEAGDGLPDVSVDAGVDAPAPDAEPLDGELPWPSGPGGVRAGSWVHAVLEELDFPSGNAKDGRSAAALLADLGLRFGFPEDVAAMLARVPGWLDTPLDGGLGIPEGFCLRRLAARERLDELAFDLRLGSGTSTSRRRRVDPDAVLLAFTEGGASSGARAWTDAIVRRARDEGRRIFPALSGILTGSVDLLFRVDGRYFLADYKTNRIAPDGRVLPVRYTRPWLAHEMDRKAYHLQALLYTVALHRFLRRRLGAAYAYERDVGGHLYLFLRAMGGPATPRSDGHALGVWADRWPARVVLGLDAALGGCTPDEARAAMEVG